MLKFWKRKSRLERPILPDEGELIAYLDGQLAPERHAEIAKLAQESWELRVRLSSLERDIETYTEATSHLDPSEIPAFENLCKGAPATDSKLRNRTKDDSVWSRAVRSVGKSLLLPRWLGLTPLPLRFTVRWIAVAAALFVATIVLIRLSSAPPVSARELLERARSAETQSLSGVSQPVVYQKLQVRRQAPAPRREEQMTWEIWNDAKNSRFKRRVEDAAGPRSVAVRAHGQVPSTEGKSSRSPLGTAPLVEELEHILHVNQMDPWRPLSPAAYQAWQGAHRKASERVIETNRLNGHRVLTLRTQAVGPFGKNDIIGAELLVRANDWHPVGERLEVQGEPGIQHYELIETAYQILALNTLNASFFVETVPSVAAETTRAESAPLTARPQKEEELMAREIEIQYALHRVKACLGEPIEVLRNPSGNIEVRGLAASSSRKEQLLAALQGVPLVSAEIRTIAEAAQTDAASSPSPGYKNPQDTSQTAETVTVQNTKLPLQEQLERYFARPSGSATSKNRAEEGNRVKIDLNIAELATGAVSLSRSALAEAWALRRLADRYGPDKTAHLSLQSQWLLEVMVRDHLGALKQAVSRSRSLVEPVLSSFASEDGSDSSVGQAEAVSSARLQHAHWTEKALLLFAQVEEIDRLTHGLFANAGLSDRQGEAAGAKLLVGLVSVGGDLQSLEQELAQDFSGNPDQQASEKQRARD